MPTIADIRQQYPQYNDMSDEQLAGALHQKFYSDMPVEQFQAKIGMTPNLDPAQIPPRNPPIPLVTGIGGTVGNILNGIPVVGPALLGAGERLAAVKHSVLEGTPYALALQDVQTKQDEFNRQNPNIARSGENAGAIGSLLVGGGTGVGAKALGITGRNLLTRTLASGTSGAAIGGADAYARGNDPVTAAEVGGAFGLASPAAGQIVGAGLRTAMGRGSPVIPTIDDMQAIKNQAYATVDNLGARYSPGSYNMLVSSMQNAAKADHLNPMRHPKAASMLDDLSQAPATWTTPGSPTLTELDQLRQIIRRDVVNTGDPAEAHFGDMMMDRIDNFIGSATPGQMAAGNPQVAAAAIRTARQANTQYRKAQMIDDALTRAARRAASTGSGGNVENAIRQNIRAILDNPNRIRAFTADERAAMNQIVAPNSRTQDMMRLVGKLSPNSSGLMAALNVGAIAHNPLMAVPAGVGIAAKGISEQMNRGRVNQLEQLVRTGGVIAPPPLTGLPSAAQQAVQAISLGAPLASLYPSPLPLPPPPSPSAL